MTDALGFDDEDQALSFCEEHGFTVSERNDGEVYVDLGSISGKYLSVDANPSRKQIFSMRLVEQKRHGRTLPAIVNGLTAAQAHSQGLVEEFSENDNSSKRSSRRSSVSDDEESLFLPNGHKTTKPSPDPMTNGLAPTEPKSQRTTLNGITKQGPASNTSPPSSESSSSAQPKPFGSNVSLSSGFFGQPTVITPSQAPVHPFASQSPFFGNSNADPSNGKREPDPKINPFKFTNNSNPSATASSMQDGPTPKANPISFFPTSTSTVTDQAATKPISTTTSTTPAKSIFDFKSASTSEPPKFSFGTSPLFNGGSVADTPQNQESSAHKAPVGSSLGANKPINQDFGPQQLPPNTHSSSPFISTESFTSPFSQLPTSSQNKEPFLPQPSKTPFSSFPPGSGTPTPTEPLSTGQPQRPTFGSSSNLPRAVEKPLETFETQNPSSPLDWSKKGSFFPAPETTAFIPTALTSNTPRSLSPLSSAKPQSPFEAAKPLTDQRPRILDALAEGLMMDDPGLLQQYIEHAIGPIVYDAFREVEDEKSWERAKAARAILLGRKYVIRWKNIAWKRKLLRRGKQRRVNLAKSMEEMARSTRQQRAQKEASFQSSLLGKSMDPRQAVSQEKTILPTPPADAELKRKSLPSTLASKVLPNAEASLGHKRKRQEALQHEAEDRPSPRRSHQPHHKRSRTMGDSSKFKTSHGRSTDFSHLDERSYINDRVMQQARRLAGNANAKLDTTRGDYFQL
ncbi:MAG: hypothetical protein Q9174_006476, partial [Haloplaca sp. 1 TL-2023]